MMSVYFVVSQVISRFRIAAPLPCAKLRDAVWAWPGLNRADDKDAMLIARLVAQLHCYAPERAELGPGQPPAFMRALGEREDWTDLRVYGALLAVGTEPFSRPGVHYLSGFYGPIERALRDMGANVEFAPADFRRLGPLLERQSPRVMTTVATPPDPDGWCSLSLHAGGTIGELRRAGADPQRLLVVEVSDAYPRTFGLGEQHRHALHVGEIDVLVRSTDGPLALPVFASSRARGGISTAGAVGARSRTAPVALPASTPASPATR
jgi:hypothetical protein